MGSSRGAALAAAIACLFVADPASARPFVTGFTGGELSDVWLDRAASTGGQVIDVGGGWAGVAPDDPSATFAPDDPASPEYRWAAVDARVLEVIDRGLEPLLTIHRAPRWAEGPGRPSTAEAGTWKPDARQLGLFATALARRYSGAFTPPGAAAPLPRVRRFKVWAEPNLSVNLAPQWSRRGRRHTAFAPVRFRAMLNAAAKSIKAVHSGNVVAAAGTAPFGDPNPGGDRIQPLAFMRTTLCLSRTLKRSCRNKTRLDAWAHDPYSIGAPGRRALNRDDASVADMAKLSRVLRAAVRRRTVTPARAKGLWVTEVSWDSRPPDPRGVPAARHARWAAEALYRFWRAGVDTVLWFQVVDQAPNPTYGSTYQSGLYLRDGRAKPAARAFRFPLVITKGRYWGRSPAVGAVTIQQRVGSRWVTAKRARTGQARVFTGRMRTVRGRTYRALSGSETSATWRY